MKTESRRESLPTSAKSASPVTLTAAEEAVLKKAVQVRASMVFRHGTELNPPHFSVGDVVSLELPAARLTRSKVRRRTCLILSNPHGDLYQLQCQYGIIKSLLNAADLRPLSQDLAEGSRRLYLDSAPSKKITVQQATKLASAGIVLDKFCSCAAKCTAGRCACMRSQRACTNICHATKLRHCGNSIANDRASLSSAAVPGTLM